MLIHLMIPQLANHFMFLAGTKFLRASYRAIHTAEPRNVLRRHQCRHHTLGFHGTDDGWLQYEI